MINAIAIDDEKNALGIIKEFCSRIPDINLAELFSDPVKALQYISGHPEIDLIFLDIQMTRLNGLALAQHLPEERTKIIITTAYPDYALQGYEIDVIDYLLKPFPFHRFERAVKKAKSILSQPGKTAASSQEAQLSPGKDDFIFVKTDYKTVKVSLSEVKYIEGSGNYVTLHTVKSKILTLQNMKIFEEQLLPYQFVRVHKSYIISLKYIDSIEKNMVMIGTVQVPLGESYRESFRKFLSENFKQF